MYFLNFILINAYYDFKNFKLELEGRNVKK